jgi:predicted transposase YdaD
MGLRYEQAFARQLVEGVYNMRESTTYQAILREGREEGLIEGRNEGLIEGRVGEAQRMLLMLGEARFGKPDEASRGTIEAIHDVERLERMTKRVLDTSIPNWNGLLSTP